jgi:anti-anti-sigma regulatory factor
MNTHPLLEEIDAEDDIGVFRLLKGVLSTEAAQAVCMELSRLASATGRTRLHLDFGGVEYLGAPGLVQFLALHAQLRAAGGGLRLCNAEGCLDLDRLSDFPIGKGQIA